MHTLGRNICAKDIVTALCDTFRDTAGPTVLYSDDGPQFASRFKGVAKYTMHFQTITHSGCIRPPCP